MLENQRPRRKTRPVKVGPHTIGGDAPVLVQSMTKTDTRDVEATVAQIRAMEIAGCELARLAVPDPEAARALKEIVKQTPEIPLCADIHFQYRLALEALDAGIAKLRLNPGNIGDADKVREVVRKAEFCNVPIRIGVNAGSLEHRLLEKYGYPTAEAMVESALDHIRILEDLGFQETIISLKASHVQLTVDAYRLLSPQVDYPLHLGITEAGSSFAGTIKSSVGLGMLLAEGIGDTIRVSLATDPEEEVRVGFEILKALDIRSRGPNIIACPTCGRLEVDLFKIVGEIEEKVAHIREPINVAVMGCAVNGPGEATHAHVGVAAGRGNGVIYRDGESVRRVSEEEIVPALLAEIEDYAKGMKQSGQPDSNTASPAKQKSSVNPLVPLS
jgi:(E)-4-hydroxy-3-methylbut-2-enyl-diphosphate synthase